MFTVFWVGAVTVEGIGRSKLVLDDATDFARL